MNEMQEVALFAMLVVGAAISGITYLEGHKKTAWTICVIFCGPMVAHVWLKGVLG